MSASLSFDGISNFDNVARYGLIIAPPDMVGAIGPAHYVQAVNSLFRVYDRYGNPLTAPTAISALFADLGTACSTRNDGLPNVLYDQFADRWLISQICTAFPPFRQMIAVSTTGDPMGAWFAYEFVMPNVKLNDFPKIAVWPSGYLMTTNEYFGSDYTGTGIFAFDREKMLVGDTDAGFIYLSIPSHTTFPTGFLPATVDGLRAPPIHEPAIFATHTATEYGDMADSIRLFNFAFDFGEPAKSIFKERPESPIVVSAFDPTSPAGRADISQPLPGEKLDSVSDTLMSRLSYRNFGTHRSIVANQTVRTTFASDAYRAGVKIYELRDAGSGYSPFTDRTIGDPTSSRWIASAAQDHQGNIGVQYNFVSDEKRVAVTFAGRLANDPANSFRAESNLIQSTGVQKGFGWRWGEYSGMSIDPIDDCSFWITNAYYTLESQDFSDFGWLTRIGKIKFDECSDAPRGTISGTVTNAATGAPVSGAKISVTPFTRRTSQLGIYSGLAMLPGTHEFTASASGYRSAASQVVVPDGSIVQDFALQPIPVASVNSTSISNESCGIDSPPNPGETVSLSVALQNNGARDATNLRAVILPSPDIETAVSEQIFGAMPVGGPPVSRIFSFSISKSVSCGSQIALRLQIFDGAEALGNIGIPLQTGKERIALSESFDRLLPSGLPPRWSRTGESFRAWKISSKRAVSGRKSLFSPAPHQMGSNAVTSPIIRITSAEARLSFKNWYEFETTFLRNRLYDGSVLEIKIGGGDWQDILAASGVFESGGYDGLIDACCQNPLGGRFGWSGRSGANQTSEFITTDVRLPPSAVGQFVQFRFRVGTDIGSFREGQYIDDLRLTDGYSCSCGN